MRGNKWFYQSVFVDKMKRMLMFTLLLRNENYEEKMHPIMISNFKNLRLEIFKSRKHQLNGI